ncbi:hypothetical protein EPO17_03660 [Patescibacteria group bacterium]|nr:MAG: hypothetical protein EPO17_03660 [Patescibacteria group bacterium]
MKLYRIKDTDRPLIIWYNGLQQYEEMSAGSLVLILSQSNGNSMLTKVQVLTFKGMGVAHVTLAEDWMEEVKAVDEQHEAIQG